MKIDGLPVNFTLSRVALEQIAVIRADYANAHPDDPPFALMVGWGYWVGDGAQQNGSVTVGYYRMSEIPQDKRHLLETVAGQKVVFFITAEDHGRFAGKTIDYAPDRAFFLR